MSSTTFVDQTTTILASWLNDVNTATYTTVPAYTASLLTKLTNTNNLSDVSNVPLARTNLGLGTAATSPATAFASSGANSNITSLSGLTTALSASQGGTGLTAPGTAGNVLTSTGSAWVSSSISGGLNPPGSIISFAGTSVPTGYLMCPLSPTNISRTTYSALFAAIGTTWGIGDGSTTFGIPYFATGLTVIQANGHVGAATVGAVIAHTHSYTTNSATGVVSGGSSPPTMMSPTSQTTGSTGGSNNYASGAYILFCVKY